MVGKVAGAQTERSKGEQFYLPQCNTRTDIFDSRVNHLCGTLMVVQLQVKTTLQGLTHTGVGRAGTKRQQALVIQPWPLSLTGDLSQNGMDHQWKHSQKVCPETTHHVVHFTLTMFLHTFCIPQQARIPCTMPHPSTLSIKGGFPNQGKYIW